MKFSLQRIVLVCLPMIYMSWIWLQSSYFNPSQLEQYVPLSIPTVFYIVVGVTLELAHLIEFGILYSLIIFSFLSFGKLNSKMELIALVISISYSITDEIHQYFVPFRSFSMADLMKNVIGIFIAWFLIKKNYYKKTKLGVYLEGLTTLSKNNT